MNDLDIYFYYYEAIMKKEGRDHISFHPSLDLQMENREETDLKLTVFYKPDQQKKWIGAITKDPILEI